MEIEERVQNDVVILKVSKDLTTGQDVAPFHDRIKNLAMGGANKVVVDFSSVRWFGSAMLGGLIAGLTTLRSAGGDLRLTGITERMDSIFAVTHLAGIFKTAETVEGAVASFRQ